MVSTVAGFVRTGRRALWTAMLVIGCRDEPPAGMRASGSAVASSPSAAVRYDDPVLDVRADDPELVAARAKARAEIDTVLERHLRSPLTELSVKAPITDGIHVEQVWIADLSYADGAFTGTIDNDPVRVKTKRAGDRITVKKDVISDYMYEESGKIRGNYTLRALLDRLPPEEAEAWRAKLGPEGQ